MVALAGAAGFFFAGVVAAGVVAYWLIGHAEQER